MGGALVKCYPVGRVQGMGHGPRRVLGAARQRLRPLSGLGQPSGAGLDAAVVQRCGLAGEGGHTAGDGAALAGSGAARRVLPVPWYLGAPHPRLACCMGRMQRFIVTCLRKTTRNAAKTCYTGSYFHCSPLRRLFGLCRFWEESRHCFASPRVSF
jgi:hypothetical protein